MYDEPMLIICRDIPGEHIGGPDCFCCPTVVSAFDSTDAIQAAIDRDALTH